MFVGHNLHVIIRAHGLIKFFVYVDRCVTQLKSACVDPAIARVDFAVLGLGIVRVHASYGRELETAVWIDIADHRSECVNVRFHHKSVVLFLRTAELTEHTALYSADRCIAESGIGIHYVFRRFFGKAGRTVDRQDLLCLFEDIFEIFLSVDLFRHRIWSFLDFFYSY